MALQKNPLEIYKLLPKTNCGQCFLPSCLAFAAAVVSGSKKLDDCPFVNLESRDRAAQHIVDREPYSVMLEEKLEELQGKVAATDLTACAAALGARPVGDKFAVTCLGKDFIIDRNGHVSSVCHTHCGLTIPLLSYLLYSKGDDISGRWIPFRELREGPPMNALFEQRGEKRLQKLADTHTELFDDLIGIFCGTTAGNIFSADIAVILYPLPRLPVLICYWKPEEDLDSKLNIFFDATADRHLPVDAIFALTIGMVMMFEKIALKHT